MQKMNEEYELIINFKSIKPFFELRDYCVDNLLEDKFFENLQNWNFQHIEQGIVARLQKENAELKLRLVGAEESTRIREKQLTEAWAQIEKMKCCGNCKNFNTTTRKCKLSEQKWYNCETKRKSHWEIE